MSEEQEVLPVSGGYAPKTTKECEEAIGGENQWVQVSCWRGKSMGPGFSSIW